MDRPGEGRAVERRRESIRPLPSHRQWAPLGRALSIVGDNWTLAIIAELAAGRTRLSALRERLAGVSAAVLDRYLQRMAESGLVTRDRFREMPPRVEFELTDAGRELLPIAAAMARWGLRWAWSEAREGEVVDLGALLRALPSLIEEEIEATDGHVELILDERGGRQRHLAEIHDGAVTMWRNGAEEGSAEPEPTSTISGDWRAWAAALGPAGETDELEISGRRKQATSLLDALVRPRVEQHPRGEKAELEPWRAADS